MNELMPSPFQHPMVELIGCALVHFLWQGLVVALPLSLGLWFLRNGSAAARYALACGGLAVLALLPVITLLVLIGRSDPRPPRMADVADERNGSLILEEHPLPSDRDVMWADSATAPPLIASPARSSAPAHTADVATGDPAWSRFDFVRWMPAIAVCWIAGVTVMSLRLLGGLWRLRSLRNRSHVVVDERLTKLLHDLARRMKLRSLPKLLQSDELDVPAVLGFWRPAFILPLSLLSGLTPAEVESILAHELAHVRRHDWIVNLVQSFIETLLFYHPVVWWVSAIVRRERENCCDDLAVAVCGNRLALAKALVRLDEDRGAAAGLAMSASGGALIQRIRRIATTREHCASARWSAGFLTLATSILLVGCLWASVAAAAKHTDVRDAPLVMQPESSTESEIEPSFKSAETSERNWSRHQREVQRVNEPTGRSHSVLAHVQLTGPDGRRTTLDMTFSNVLNYTFIPARVAQELGAIDLGEIDFGNTSPQTQEMLVPIMETEIPAHSQSWTLNPSNEGPGNALVLDDANSSLGVLGRNWARMPRSDEGEGIVWSATGDFHMSATAQADTRTAPNPPAPHTEQDPAPLQADETPWGRTAENSGLQSRLTLQTERPTLGQPLLVKLELRNTSQKPATFDPQDYVPFRILRVEMPQSDRSPPFIGRTPQTSGESRTLQPGEVQTLWENVDVAELFLIDESREYEIFAEGGEWAMQARWRDSNRIRLRVHDGELPPRQRLIAALIQVLPKDWTLSVGEGELYLQHSPTNLKKDVVWFAIRYRKEKLADDFSVAWPVPGEERVVANATIINLGETELGYVHLLGHPQHTERIWPDYLKVIEGAIDRTRHAPDTKRPWQATGRVTDQNGRPIAGATVSAHCGMGTLMRTGSAVTGADGQYALQFGPGIMSDDPHMLQVATISVALDGHVEKNLHRQGDCIAALEKPEGEDQLWGGKTIDDLFLPGEPKVIDFVMVAAASLCGAIVDASGAQLQGVQVSLVGDQLPPSTSAVSTTRTDANGRFELPGIPTGYSWQLLVEPADAEAPFPGWASPLIEFALDDSGRTQIGSPDRGELRKIAVGHLTVTVHGAGTNWRRALAAARLQDLVLRPTGPAHANGDQAVGLELGLTQR